MKNLLYCKGCKNLQSYNYKDCKGLRKCALDNKCKADDGKLWKQYSNDCPLKKYLGKADLDNNPVIFSEGK